MRTRLAFLIILLSTVGMHTQNSSVGTHAAINIESPLISLDVAVFDNHGKSVTNLNRSDFELREDGIPQSIAGFTPVESPYSVLLLFDCRDSLRDRLHLLTDAMTRFANQLRPVDHLEVAVFGSEVQIVHDWSWDKKENVRFGDIPACQSADMYGALNWSSREIRKIAGRRSVVVFSNGLQSEIALQEVDINGNKVHRIVPPSKDIEFQNVAKAVQEAGALFYFVAVDTDLNPDAHHSGPVQDLQQIRARMEELAELSGGRVAFPRESSEVVPLFLQIGRDLGSSYSIAYTPRRPLDARYHTIDVRIREENYQVELSRTGYTAREPLPR